MSKSNQNLPEIISTIPNITNRKAGTPLSALDVNSSSTLPSGRGKDGRPHLVLHFDINETILVGDEAGGDTREDCLNKVLSKVAFVQIPSPDDDDESRGKSDLHPKSLGQFSRSYYDTNAIRPERWWDGSPIVEGTSSSSSSTPLPPASPLYVGWQWPKDTCPYYRTSFKRRAKTFTEHHGSMYRPLYHKLDRRLSSSTVYHNMLPSFFHTLVSLQKDNVPYTLVLRTFGSDLPDIAALLTDFAKGGHPSYPNFREPNLVLEKKDLFRGRWRDGGDGGRRAVYDLMPYGGDGDGDGDGVTTTDKGSMSKRVVASGDREVLDWIESRTVLGIQDHYEFWNENGYAPWSGKPIWIREGDSSSRDGDDDDDDDDDGDTTMTVRETNTGEKGSPPPPPSPPPIQQQSQRRRRYHHLFFDDNIHNDPTDGIVSVRVYDKASGAFLSVDGEEGLTYHGKHMVRVPTVSAILEDGWFLERIEAALDGDGGERTV